MTNQLDFLEVQNLEIKKIAHSGSCASRFRLAIQGSGLDILVNDKESDIRRVVAQHGYGLEKLVNDENWLVREEVAKQGYRLEILINDKHCGVRTSVAKQGYGLDKLINDESWGVRLAVAQQGYGLETLINDKIWMIRRAVAEQNYGLSKLISDKNRNVTKVVFHLEGSKTEILHKNFGTYKGPLYVHVWEDKYEIKSGCYTTNSIEEWSVKCTEKLGQETSNLYTEKIKKILQYG